MYIFFDVDDDDGDNVDDVNDDDGQHEFHH